MSEKKLIIIQISEKNTSWEKRCLEQLDCGMTVIGYLVSRLKQVEQADIMIATTQLEEDDGLELTAAELGIDIYRGSLYDIPSRLYHAAQKYGCEHLIRVNANSPLVDPGLMQKLYEMHVSGGYDYSYNEHVNGVLWGMGCDVFRVAFLEELCRQNLTDNQKETVGLYIRQNKERYRVLEYRHSIPDRKVFKLNIESRRDFDVVNDVVNHVETVNQEGVYDYLSHHKLISQYNIESPPREAGIEKLFLNPDKVGNILKRERYDLSYPVSVEMTLTNTCNLKCVYCSDMMLRERQGVKEHLEFSTIRRLFQDLAEHGTKGVVLEGGGEPTLYPQFEEVVAYAQSQGLAVGLITNGTRHLSQELLRSFEWIRVSLDASTQEEYVKLKGVDLFEHVISNIADYAASCRTVGVGYVVTKENISQIEPLLLRLRAAGVSYVQLRPVVDCEELYPEHTDLSYLKFYEKKDFGVETGGMRENAYSGNHGLPCFAHSITSIISGDGSVYICGRLNIYDWMRPIGNITEQSFSEIWNGEERKKQAQMIQDGRFCRKYCPQCRVSKFNELFSRLDKVQSRHFI